MPTVLALVRDLFFRSKLDAVAGALGVELNYASDLAGARKRAEEKLPTLVMVDLSDRAFPAAETIAELKSAAPAARVVGFASHVDLKVLRGAREAGFDQALSRSEFTARVAEFLKPSG